MPEFSADALLPILERLPSTARLWVAFSGGCDSHVLLDACTALRGRLAFALAAVHVDHGLHPDSARWAEHCRYVCADLGVPLSIHRIRLKPQRGESLEALARSARHRVLKDRIGPGDVLATAHHRDDQAETLLLALLRGSGPHGLAAMPAQMPLGNGVLARPLLGFSQDELRAYATKRSLGWIDDPSNKDQSLDRNRLRHRIMPTLRERWPSAAVTMSRSAAHCAEAAALIDAFVDDLLPQLAGGCSDALSIRRLIELDAPRQSAVLRRWLARQGFRPPSATRLSHIRDDVLGARADAAPSVAWAGCEVRRYRDDLVALAPLPPAPRGPLMWDPARPLELPCGLGRLVAEISDPPYAAGLRVCFNARGLRCRAADQRHRTLKNVFQEAGVPPWLRPYVPLVLGPERELLAVSGVRACGTPGLAVSWQGHPWAKFGWLAD